MQETWVRSLGWEDFLEKGMATHFSILAWRIPWTEERGSPWDRKELDTTEQLTLPHFHKLYSLRKPRTMTTQQERTPWHPGCRYLPPKYFPLKGLGILWKKWLTYKRQEIYMSPVLLTVPEHKKLSKTNGVNQREKPTQLIPSSYGCYDLNMKKIMTTTDHISNI